MTIGSAAFLPGSASRGPAPRTGRSFGGQSGARVLLAEPRYVTALDLQRTLREASYRIVGPVATAAEVRALVDRGEIDGAIEGAIVDLALDPGSVAAIVALLDRAGIPVLFLSGPALRELPKRHRNGTLLAKPYGRAELLQAVDRLVADGREDNGDDALWYPVSPPPVPWPRVFPQL